MLAQRLPQDEVLVGRDLPLVDFLRPLLKRHLDAERLVDGEGDVEEVQAVDAEIVDGVAVRRDLLTRDVACFGNDSSDGFEGRRHRSAPATRAGTNTAAGVPQVQASGGNCSRYIQWRRLPDPAGAGLLPEGRHPGRCGLRPDRHIGRAAQTKALPVQSQCPGCQVSGTGLTGGLGIVSAIGGGTGAGGPPDGDAASDQQQDGDGRQCFIDGSSSARQQHGGDGLGGDPLAAAGEAEPLGRRRLHRDTCAASTAEDGRQPRRHGARHAGRSSAARRSASRRHWPAGRPGRRCVPAAWARKRALSASFQAASDGGKWRPMSPSASAP